jgi:hypothetical protein
VNKKAKHIYPTCKNMCHDMQDTGYWTLPDREASKALKYNIYMQERDKHEATKVSKYGRYTYQKKLPLVVGDEGTF